MNVGWMLTGGPGISRYVSTSRHFIHGWGKCCTPDASAILGVLDSRQMELRAIRVPTMHYELSSRNSEDISFSW